MITRWIQANKCLDITSANADDVSKFICAFVVIDNQHLGGEEVPFSASPNEQTWLYSCPFKTATLVFVWIPPTQPHRSFRIMKKIFQPSSNKTKKHNPRDLGMSVLMFSFHRCHLPYRFRDPLPRDHFGSRIWFTYALPAYFSSRIAQVTQRKAHNLAWGQYWCSQGRILCNWPSLCWKDGPYAGHFWLL